MPYPTPAKLFAAILATLALGMALTARVDWVVETHPKEPTVKVIDAQCEKGLGAVDKLEVEVTGPGVVTLTWDNAELCGVRS